MANTKIKGKVIKGVKGRYLVMYEDGVINCVARGRLLLSDRVCVGDNVVVVKEKGMHIIESILPRKNQLIRPPVANIDILAIIVAPLPATDWMLVDKLLVFAAEYKIRPILCYNKVDLSKDELDYTNSVYGEIADTVAISAVTGEGIAALKSLLEGVVCFAGQSAVGKTSILNVFCNTQRKVGDLSRYERGRHTTRHVEILPFEDNIMLVDTCGFSLLDLEGIKPEELMLYYPDFLKLGRCRYNMCTHINEPDCEVKKAIDEKRIDKNRYLRYTLIYDELKEKGENYD